MDSRRKEKTFCDNIFTAALLCPEYASFCPKNTSGNSIELQSYLRQTAVSGIGGMYLKQVCLCNCQYRLRKTPIHSQEIYTNKNTFGTGRSTLLSFCTSKVYLKY